MWKETKIKAEISRQNVNVPEIKLLLCKAIIWIHGTPNFSPCCRLLFLSLLKPVFPIAFPKRGPISQGSMQLLSSIPLSIFIYSTDTNLRFRFFCRYINSYICLLDTFARPLYRHLKLSMSKTELIPFTCIHYSYVPHLSKEMPPPTQVSKAGNVSSLISLSLFSPHSPLITHVLPSFPSATTLILATIIYQLNFCDCFLINLPASSLVSRQTIFYAAGTVIFLRCDSNHRSLPCLKAFDGSPEPSE